MSYIRIGLQVKRRSLKNVSFSPPHKKTVYYPEKNYTRRISRNKNSTDTFHNLIYTNPSRFHSIFRFHTLNITCYIIHTHVQGSDSGHNATLLNVHEKRTG